MTHSCQRTVMIYVTLANAPGLRRVWLPARAGQMPPALQPSGSVRGGRVARPGRLGCATRAPGQRASERWSPSFAGGS
ncbi:hypothetical protein [Ornithinimicrobium kibberense]|uniref:hypothetical protein n=1 Tax=Ornithinimicrobium kibberense TaxID=282060 RepID=UPI0036206537